MVTVSANKTRQYDGSDYMAAAQIAEELFLRWMRACGRQVEDLRAIPSWQEQDVDFRVTASVPVLVEVKSDRHIREGGNVLCEVLRLNHTAPPDRACILGWSVRTSAEWLYYYAPAERAFYTIRSADLRTALQEYTADARRKTELRFIETDELKSTIVVLIPWRYCAPAMKVYPVPENFFEK